MENFKPIRDRVLVEKIKDELKTKGGLQLSQDAQDRPTKGTILAVGPGKLTDDGTVLPMPVNENDIIYYPKYAGYPIKLNNEEYLILDEKDILGVYTGDQTNG